MSWNKSNINKLCLNMDLISTTDLELMQNLCEAFPYAGLFVLSLLEGLHKTDDIRLNAKLFGKHLNNHAAFRVIRTLKNNTSGFMEHR